MKISQVRQKGCGFVKVDNKQTISVDVKEQEIDLISTNVVLTTKEISLLIEQLMELKKEGRKKSGYHFHLTDDSIWSAKAGDEIFEVTFEHQKNFQ